MDNNQTNVTPETVAPAQVEAVPAPTPAPAAPEVPVTPSVQPVEPVQPVPVEQAPVTPEVPGTPVAAPAAPASDVVTSGTATEEEIEIDASKPNVEVLDEYAINKDVEESKSKNKKNWTFIILFFAILFIAVFAFKYIIKYIGI